ncbi:hypothetical protein F0562_011412 [Nyssa sinensis]|uniref:glutathione transferase n=1 Tax=Nyssa sinensis TaxID=561372 RepID=A0A5J5A3E3_9ASTE|nr:hypothetical protein F0562_011412 [Nyssa sinensis]
MADEEVVLLDLWVSPFAMRVRIALAEKGIHYESKEEDLNNKSPLLLKMNPVHKKIPVLIHNGKPVCESLTIVQYIDEVWKVKSPLLPSDPYKLAHARFWADYVDKKIFSIGRTACMSTGEVQEGARKELIECFKLLEAELGAKPYFGDETFGLVDIALIPVHCWFYAFKMFCNLNMAVECPKIVAWDKRCMKKESVSKTLVDQHKFYEFLLGLRKKHGVE